MLQAHCDELLYGETLGLVTWQANNALLSLSTHCSKLAELRCSTSEFVAKLNSILRTEYIATIIIIITIQLRQRGFCDLRTTTKQTETKPWHAAKTVMADLTRQRKLKLKARLRSTALGFVTSCGSEGN